MNLINKSQSRQTVSQCATPDLCVGQPLQEGWLWRGSQLGILSTATVSQCVIPHLCVGQPLQEGWLWRGSQLGILPEGEAER
jgi:hypothetical protein